jgi:hypothetical protein
MKCPKCGFNSFEFLDACKKCGSEFASFKKSHRINPVIIRSGAVPLSPESTVPTRDFVSTPARLQDETPAFAADGEFSWEAPGEAPSSGLAESPYSGFNLDFPDSSPTETKDMEFTGFSFITEPSADSSSSLPEVHGNDFSFVETAVGEDAPPLWDAQPDVPGSEMEKYQRMLEPDSMGESMPAFDAEEATGEQGYFGAADFNFAPEQATEDIFQKEAELADFAFAPEQAAEDIFQKEADPAVIKHSEKKSQPVLENFDKEFEMIFAVEDQDEPEEKNRS